MALDCDHFRDPPVAERLIGIDLSPDDDPARRDDRPRAFAVFGCARSFVAENGICGRPLGVNFRARGRRFRVWLVFGAEWIAGPTSRHSAR